MPQEILLLEDDDSLNHSVSLKLKKEGYTVHSAFTVKEALRFYQSKNLSLILCDISLPDGSGLDFCTQVRKESDVLFLFLTALDREEDLVAGYRQGADDYITKPFSMTVLTQKVNALLKRFTPNNPKSIVSGDIALYPDEGRAAKNGRYLSLTAREYSLLSFFMENPMRILSRNQLLEGIWDIDGNFVDENTLSVNIRRLREKIEDDPSDPAILKNIRGLGYIWERKCEKK
ncbi:MAG: response regulator transcription factor [Bacteroidales bacterium]|nr:response regulator transcription factor [Bacteroidales bacterium]MCM1416138.1 response regulator transcription factor [bacterium]MCM1423053.1 response regulator transcription factor [bacterium]